MQRTALFLAITALTATGALAGTLTKEDVLRLLAAGVSPDVVAQKLHASSCTFSLTSAEVIELTKQRVPEPVLLAMIGCAPKPELVAADPCDATLRPSAVAFPDLEWDQAGLHLDYVTLFVSSAGVCLKRVEDQVRRPIPWANISAVCDESFYLHYVYLKLAKDDPTLASFGTDRVLTFKGPTKTLLPLFTYIRKVRPQLTVSCTSMETP